MEDYIGPYTWQNSGGNSISPLFDDTIMYIFNNPGIQDSTRLIVINTHGCSDTSVKADRMYSLNPMV